MADDPIGTRPNGAPPPHQRLFSLLRTERADIAVVVSFSMISGILYLAAPLAVDAVVQNIAFGGEQQVFTQALLILSFALLVFLALMSVITAAQHYVAELIQQRVFVRLSADMAHRLPRLSLKAIEHPKTPEFINRFLDVATLQKSAAMILLDGVNIVLSSLLGLLVLAFYHPSLLVFDAVLILVLLFILFPLGRNGVKSSVGESSAKHAVAGWFEEMVLFPMLFKSACGADLALHRADHLVNEYLTRRKKHYRVLIRQILGLLLLQAIASASLLAVGGALVLHGELTLGQLVASELIVGAVIAAIVGLGKHLETWYDAMAATDKLGTLVDLPVEPADGEQVNLVGEPLEVCLQAVPVPSSGQKHQEASIHVQPGEKVGIRPEYPQACATILKTAFGLCEPGQGAALVAGLDVRQWNLSTLRRHVFYLETPELFTGTILENVRMGDSDISPVTVREAIQRVGLGDEIDHLPQGMESPVTVHGGALPRSRRVLLCLARALVMRPGLLLVHRIFDGLDAEEIRIVSSILFAPDAPWTLILVTGNEELIRHCDRVAQPLTAHS